MEKDNRSPDRQYIFPSEERLDAEKKKSKPDDIPQPEAGSVPESPKSDISKSLESQGVGSYDVPPPDKTISTQ